MMLALGGCASYQPRPLDPEQVARRFERRTIANPGVCAYLGSNLAARPSACPPARWDLAALTLVGFYYSPDIAVADTQVQSAEAAIVTAGARPNPVVGLGPQYDLRSSPSFAPWALGYFSLDLPIETAGKRGYRIAASERLADAARLAAGETAWSVRSRIRTALVRLLLDRTDADLAAKKQRTLAAAVELIDARVRTGYAGAPELDLARSNLGGARLAAAQAQARVEVDHGALAAALGIPEQALGGVEFSWDALDDPPGEESLSRAQAQRMAVLNRIDLRRELAQYSAADEALKLEIAEQYPDLNLAGGYSWEGGENIFELGPSLALPVFNQNQGPIRQARTQRDLVAAQFLAMQAGVIAQARIALINYRGALAALAAARSAASHQARRYRQARRALAAGESDALAASTVRVQDLDTQAAALQALRNTQLALGALEDAMQRPLDPAASGRFAFPPPRPQEGQ